MFKFTSNGRETPLERFADELRKDITRAAREGIEAREASCGRALSRAWGGGA